MLNIVLESPLGRSLWPCLFALKRRYRPDYTSIITPLLLFVRCCCLSVFGVFLSGVLH